MVEELRQSPSVSIDGEAIRRVREDKRLTQLYVSKVVGVTTDTVSRWENNRYPTIRRDNAIKLAEALEVSLNEILRQDEPSEQAPDTVEAIPRKTPWGLLILLVILIVIAAAVLLNNNVQHPPQIQAKRLLPPYAAPGSRILVRVHLSSEKPLKGMILREEYPVGWKLVASEPPASGLDNEVGKVRWIFRKPSVDTRVSYLLEVAKSAKAGTAVELKGELIANPDGQRSAIPLQSVGQMEVQPLHWADSNGNGIIEDLEILEYSNLLDETGQLLLDWDLVESLWDAGGYSWDREKGEFIPQRPADTQPATQPVN
jgi:transcriptional regulator with XRE-family HTH domain